MYRKQTGSQGEVIEGEVVEIATNTTIPIGSRLWPVYEAWLAEGNLPEEAPPRVITADLIKGEAQRRIIALTGKTTLIDCMIKQSNANMRANKLNDKRLMSIETGSAPLSTQEADEAQALRNFNTMIEHIRDRSNVIEAMTPIPADYTNDSYWA